MKSKSKAPAPSVSAPAPSTDGKPQTPGQRILARAAAHKGEPSEADKVIASIGSPRREGDDK